MPGSVTSPVCQSEDTYLDATLRPKEFKEYIGQDKIKESLSITIKAAKNRGDSLDHLLFYGPAGLGKTTLAHIVTREMQTNIKATSGPALERTGDLASLLTNLEDGDILFIDEIHRLNRTVEEALYPAMEDFHLDIVIGKGPGAQVLQLNLPRFTLVGATTRVGLLTNPLRSRFGGLYRLHLYSEDEIKQIVFRSAKILGIPIKTDGAEFIAQCSRCNPRVANRLLKRVRDFAQVKGNGIITREIAKKALKMLEIDSLGLEGIDREILRVTIEKFNGGPVGVQTLAAALGEEEDTLIDVYEPYLMVLGFFTRTPRGRVVTPKGYEHLGMKCVDSLF
ncbi:MAG: Holliday junction branch migration DNA helicase RuvB [Candidatus Moranbacteria bacterium]|nr:Holliday junction branch migration DNA helicase RuvB [Candidatus Moranbacteria bacterium]